MGGVALSADEIDEVAFVRATDELAVRAFRRERVSQRQAAHDMAGAYRHRCVCAENDFHRSDGVLADK
jgi:hypothetical protein